MYQKRKKRKGCSTYIPNEYPKQIEINDLFSAHLQFFCTDLDLGMIVYTYQSSVYMSFQAQFSNVSSNSFLLSLLFILLSNSPLLLSNMYDKGNNSDY